MSIHEQILQNVSPLRIARDVSAQVARASDNNIIHRTAQSLLHSIMDAIGFHYYASITEISILNFQWPSSSTSYEFQYDHVPFDRFLHFLKQFCLEMNRNGRLEQLTNIIDIFLNFCNSVHEQWDDAFDEPFSLISLSILQSMHKIRTEQEEPYLVFDSMCDQLFKRSQKGLGFEDSHQPILKGLCVLLSKDYGYFTSFDSNILKFYCDCIEYEYCTANGALFVHMKAALENSQAPESEKVNLVNFLTDSKMIHVYCVFAQQASKTQVYTVLRFLNTLLSHVPVLECFSQVHVHVVFENALDESKRNSSEAMKFYLTYMRRCYNDKFILRDILDFLVVKARDTSVFDSFIELLWDEFPYITTLDPFLKILQKTNWDIRLLSVAAQVAYRVFQKLFNEMESNEEYPLRLNKFLMKTPTLLMLLKDKWQVRGIILKIYSEMDFDRACHEIRDFRIAADRFITYAQRYLKRGENDDEDYSIVQNTVYVMFKLMGFLKMTDEMQEFANFAFAKYEEQVSRRDASLTKREVIRLQNTLIILSNLQAAPFALHIDKLMKLLAHLRDNLIDGNKLQEISTGFDCFLYPFAIKTYFGCVTILSKYCDQLPPDDSAMKVQSSYVNAFFIYLFDYLSNANLSNSTIYIMEATICCLCDLYKLFNFQLESQVYHVLVNCVHQFVFEAPKLKKDQLRQLELQKKILNSFNLMHRTVEVPVPITWKISLYYGMKPKFEYELTDLLDILFEYDSERFRKPALFTYVVPVAIFNLSRKDLPMRTFQQALNALKTYVGRKMTHGSERIMKIHIVLTMIDMIERTLITATNERGTNRVQLLTSLSDLLRDAYQTELDLVSNSVSRLENQLLTPIERDTLTRFQNQFT